jgi:hypothetical protein
MNKIKNLLKRSPITMVIAGVLVAGVASAAVLAVYVTMVGTGDVLQAVVFGNDDTTKEYTIGESPAIAGNTYTETYNLKNRSETTAPVKFVTNQCIVGGGHCGDTNHDEPGVETSYWSTLELENKNTSTWQPITDSTKGTLTYELVSSAFNYKFEATGLAAETEYFLIYYADRQDRFVNWGGDNPGALIATFTTDSNGNILETAGSQNLAMNLPHADDWNGVADPDYCDNHNTYDDYDLCRGAKIWLVPSGDYNATEKTVSWANYTSYLYETDLITYDDSDTDGEALYLGTGLLNFFVKNVLAVNLAPGEYKVKTEVLPVE